MNSSKPKRFLRRRQQAERWNVHVRTVMRWGDDPAMGMPPELDLNGIPVRAEDEIEAWEQSRVRLTKTKRRRSHVAEAASSP